MNTGYPEYIKDCYRTRATGRTSPTEYHDLPRQEMEMDGEIWSGFGGRLILREYDLLVLSYRGALWLKYDSVEQINTLRL